MCVPLPGKHVPNDMCSSTWETHIPSDVFSLPVKHISLVMCVLLPGKHIPSDMCSPTWEKHISQVMCVPYLRNTYL